MDKKKSKKKANKDSKKTTINGTTIVQLPSGNWYAKVYSHMDGSGTRIDEHFTNCSPEDVAFDVAVFKLEKMKNKKNKLKSKKNNYDKMILGDAIDKYIEMKDGVLSPTTIQGYKKIRKHRLKDLMNTQLKDIDQTRIQEEINKEAKIISPYTKKKLSPKTISNIHGLLSSTLKAFLPNTPELRTTLPAKVKKIIELPPAAEVIKLVTGTPIELPCMLAIWMSYSLSEVRGIKASALSEDGYIVIKEVVVDVGGKATAKEAAKEYERIRKAQLPNYLFELIKKQETYINFRNTGVDGYIVSLSGSAIYKRFIRMQEEANFQHITFHQLRHLNASVMLALDIPDKYAMERGGWKTPHTLKSVYQHTFSDERKAVDKKVNDYFEKIIE